MRTRITKLGRKLLSKVRRPKRLTWLDSFGFRTVLDVGANTGQFVDEARLFAPDAMIYSFEPLPDCYATLVKRHRADPRFRAFNFALGDAPGETTFHRSSYSQSSSMLKMAALHVEAFPETAGGEEVTIPVDTLDNVRTKLELRGPVLLKIDVQGFEDAVLRGAERSLARCTGLHLELSLVPLYEGALPFAGMVEQLAARGFVLTDLHPGFNDPRSGELLQVDGTFFRLREGGPGA